MRTLSLDDLEQTVPAEGLSEVRPATRTDPGGRFTLAQWLLLGANHAGPLALLCALALEGEGALRPLLAGSAGYLVLAGLAGGLCASAGAMYGLLLLTNRAAPAGRSSPRFRALCLALVWSMTTVLFTAPLCVALFHARALVDAVGAG